MDQLRKGEAVKLTLEQAGLALARLARRGAYWAQPPVVVVSPTGDYGGHYAPRTAPPPAPLRLCGAGAPMGDRAFVVAGGEGLGDEGYWG